MNCLLKFNSLIKLLTDPIHQFNYGDYLYQLGMIDENGHHEFKKYENRAVNCMAKHDYLCAFKEFGDLLTANRYPRSSLFKNLTGFTNTQNFMLPKKPKEVPLARVVERPDMRRALHVGNNFFNHLVHNNPVKKHMKIDVLRSYADWVAELLSHYPMLIYNGQLDIIGAYPLTENYLKHLKFSGAEEYKTAPRHIWRVGREIAGYAKHAGNLTHVMVRNAGMH